MFKGFVMILLSASSVASADVYLSVGDSVRIGGERIHCGITETEQRMYRCSMEVCIDPWNNISDDKWMCEKATGSYKFENRTEVGSNKQEIFNSLSSGIHKPETFSCIEI